MIRWIAICICCTFPISLLAGKPALEDPNPQKNLQPIEVIGILRLVGNEPFPRLVLVDSKHTLFFLETTPHSSIRKHIGSRVKVKGYLDRREIYLADKTRLADELYIINFQWVLLPDP